MSQIFNRTLRRGARRQDRDREENEAAQQAGGEDEEEIRSRKEQNELQRLGFKPNFPFKVM